MKRKDWNNLLDKYLTMGTMSSEDYEALNEMQIIIIQEIKKSYARRKKEDSLS